jgi:prepilin-type processing-associated H-X9-DG protein
MDLIQPYIKNEGVFNCPSAPAAYVKYDEANNKNYGHYTANATYDTSGDGVSAPFSTTNSPINVARIQAPTTTVMVVDGRGVTGSTGVDYMMNWSGTSLGSNIEFRNIGVDTVEKGLRCWVWKGSTPVGAIAERHLETINVLWADGHVKAVKLEAITAGKIVSSVSATDKIYTSWTNEDD